jgi:hypothetical protein
LATSLSRQLSSFLDRDISPTALEDLHRHEARTAHEQARQRIARAATGVLGFRKARVGMDMQGLPDMQSVYEGRAGYLDYKKRTKPLQTSQLLQRLQDPLTKTLETTDPRFLRKHSPQTLSRPLSSRYHPA